MYYFEYERDENLGQVNCVKWMDQGKVVVYFDDGHYVPAHLDEFCEEVQLKNRTARVIFNWVMYRPEKVFYMNHFNRLGFCELLNDQEICERDYQIMCVVLADASDIRYAVSGYYGSEKLSVCPSTFWPIDFHTLNLTQNVRGVTSAPNSDDLEESDHNLIQRIIIKLTSRTKAKWMNEIEDYCIEHLQSS